ncbi:hypothetical protein I6G47_11275 [Delftia lacustris]|uniref:Uncharacterized protein n=1 Tax=Delftia lacustris TaxID=558537 RepID=A0A7T2YWT3_9BURK|nr:hypothetical protein [Delftia lacustris]QPS83600.1 hypothetical protein I6G47_11275 [Delftia lacustris]
MPEITIAARRTEPRVHCWARPINGDYVRSDRTPPDHLANVFAAERERLAAAKPRRQRKPRAVATEINPAQLRLVG